MTYTNEARRRWIAAAALGVILLLGVWTRLHDIERRTLDHPEVYAPGIDLPWHLSNPNPRFTLWQTLAGTFAGEPHPPGYYIVMLGWTKAFGSSILALRFPSLLFGAAGILLIYLVAIQTEDRLTGLLAAAMLAGNGLHLYWSQNARMYAMGSFLGLLSTLFLISIARNRPHQRTYGVLYSSATLAGLATHVYFWPLFAAQALWVALRSFGGVRSAANLLRLQILILTAASPLAAIAVFQSETATRPGTQEPIAGVLRYLQVGSLLETNPFALPFGSLATAAAAVALLATLFLVAVFFLSGKKEARDEPEAPGGVAPPWVVTASLAVLMALCILGIAYVAKSYLPGRSIMALTAMSVVPIGLALVDYFVLRSEARSWGLGRILDRRNLPQGTVRSLPLFLALVPVSAIAAVSLVNPMLIPRGMLFFAPYLLIVLGGALAALIYRDKRWIALAAVLAVLHVSSVLYFKSKPGSPDYKALASRWEPKIQESDLIFVHGRGLEQDWRVAPIFYYVKADRYRFIGKDFRKAVEDHPRSRIWVLAFPAVPMDSRIVESLRDYSIQERLEALKIYATLYVPALSSGSP